ncbi:hypothetical protein PSEUBRA_004470 [Kalmanozyma brasiliensis GHG001]|uniref:uncharacterized protein n=1 Tax=Kalmanozyma brasiliensis (strain GHG001) TaxID=1365824 RepID=UPI0028680843|nr:uncharacterized protein PSEUBRA_004470 [Kalmanozyma brasiliensis GHG001]KAF6767384.1 hypothetical protein PSEUBRA_004470 [Kalmanozyma brasiliensis GHG001]
MPPPQHTPSITRLDLLDSLSDYDPYRYGESFSRLIQEAGLSEMEYWYVRQLVVLSVNHEASRDTILSFLSNGGGTTYPEAVRVKVRDFILNRTVQHALECTDGSRIAIPHVLVSQASFDIMHSVSLHPGNARTVEGILSRPTAVQIKLDDALHARAKHHHRQFWLTVNAGRPSKAGKDKWERLYTAQVAERQPLIYVTRGQQGAQEYLPHKQTYTQQDLEMYIRLVTTSEGV